MLEMLTGPVKILAYRQPTDDDDKPMARRDGSAVVMCEFSVEGEERVRQILLDPRSHDNRPPLESVVQLLLTTSQEPVARNGANGPYVTWAVKFKIVGSVTPDTSGAKPATAAKGA